MSPLKHPRRVNVAKPRIVPDGRATTLILGLAALVVDEATVCCETEMRRAAAISLLRCLDALDRVPPADFDVRWEHLLGLIVAQRKAEQAGRPWDEIGKDFDAEIAVELEALAGRPR